ncbi:MAG: helix-turn-helix domain-containing protein [Nitrolancea sp.]
MPEITLRDLCRWDRRLSVIPPTGVPLDVALDRGVSWAVSVRAAPPLLPPLRGEELVVLPLRVLEQIELGETLTRENLLSKLAEEKIAAVLTEPAFSEEPIDQLPILTLPAPFPHDAEGTLNRMITERRAELYRLGAELSRRLSQAAVDPRGISAILGIATELSGRPLVLEDGDGNVVASTGGEGHPGGQRLVSGARTIEGTLLSAEADDGEYLIVALSGAARPSFLSMRGEPGTLTESDRLILLQTAGMCSTLLGQQPRPASSDRGVRERQIADLLYGRLATNAAALARGHVLGIGTTGQALVGLIERDDRAVDMIEARNLVTGALGPDVAQNLATLDGVIGFLFSGLDANVAHDALKRALARPGAPPFTVAISHPLESVVNAPAGLREVRFALDLARDGAVAERVISCSSVDDLGIYSILFPLWGNSALEVFKSTLLGELEAYDRRRKSELIATLEAYLMVGGALSEAADRLQIHRNTLSYRLQRIGELTQRDLSDPRERLLLQVALIARHMPPLADEDRAKRTLAR